ncbi:UNVERIFIED_CONTAM: hypothetical protein Slati_0322700 [Sesamum latifolium]|uniref:Uncharacterized protein n=1 Tax=Sesamum latifolium TaxID=2727402 RepID=A0AAW2YEM4_9LAMI
MYMNALDMYEAAYLEQSTVAEKENDKEIPQFHGRDFASSGLGFIFLTALLRQWQAVYRSAGALAMDANPDTPEQQEDDGFPLLLLRFLTMSLHVTTASEACASKRTIIKVAAMKRTQYLKMVQWLKV